MKKYLLIAILILASFAFAEYIDYDSAEKVAKFHIKSFDKYNYSIKGNGFKLILDDGRPAAWIFHLSPSGYIAIAPDNRFHPIIAFSKKSVYRPFSDQNIMQSIIKTDFYHKYGLVDKYPKELLSENRQLWNRYLSNDADLLSELDDYLEFGPWIQTNWSQGEPYNAHCPIDPETGERCITGCTQTACAMILEYWQHPEEIILTHYDSYTSRRTSPGIYLDGPEASLDEIIWNRANATVPTMDMVARVMLAIGILNRASYSSSATAADISGDTYNDRLGFYGSYDASPMTSRFMDRMAISLMKGKPIQMSMMSMEEGGHSIVNDGWREDGFFHLNMGWGGYENGWYNLTGGSLPEGYRWITRTVLNITAPAKMDVPSTVSGAVLLHFSNVSQEYLNSIESSSDTDMYKFYADYDSLYMLYTRGPRDTRVEIFNEDGESIAVSDTGAALWNFKIQFEPPEDGLYYAEISAADSVWDSNYHLYYQRMPGPERPFIQTIHPTGGERLIGGESVSIYFTKGGEPYIDMVRVEFSTTGREGPWNLIADSLTANYVRWELPVYSGDRPNSFIKITSCANDHIYDMNDSPFRIRDPEAITEGNPIPENLEIASFPNPFNGSTFISIPANSDIRIFDTSGKLVHQRNDTGSFTWKLENCAESGIYIIEVDNNSQKRYHKITYIK
ncbi:MAG: C10 family peptidase [Candidatus Zixiibacteriota bacterium]